MTDTSKSQSFASFRRADRAVTDETWIKNFLHTAAYGVFASAVDGKPFINANLFVFDEQQHAIYWHTANQGGTHDSILANPRVCFSVSQIGRLLPAEVALEFSVEYAGVTVFGNAYIIEEQEQAIAGLQKLLDKYIPHLQPGVDYRPPTPLELKRTAVYRLEIESWSGKRKKAPQDFPGAYYYNERAVIQE